MRRSVILLIGEDAMNTLFSETSTDTSVMTPEKLRRQQQQKQLGLGGFEYANERARLRGISRDTQRTAPGGALGPSAFAPASQQPLFTEGERLTPLTHGDIPRAVARQNALGADLPENATLADRQVAIQSRASGVPIDEIYRNRALGQLDRGGVISNEAFMQGAMRGGIAAPIAQGEWQRGIGNIGTANIEQNGMTTREGMVQRGLGDRLTVSEGGLDRRLGITEGGLTTRQGMAEKGLSDRLGLTEDGLNRRLGITEGGLTTRQGMADESARKLEELRGGTAREISRSGNQATMLAPLLSGAGAGTIEPTMVGPLMAQGASLLDPNSKQSLKDSLSGVLPSRLPGELGAAMSKAPTYEIEAVKKAQDAKDWKQLALILKRNNIPEDVANRYLQSASGKSWATINNPNAYAAGAGWLPFTTY
jgi:hypothetical protein